MFWIENMLRNVLWEPRPRASDWGSPLLGARTNFFALSHRVFLCRSRVCTCALHVLCGCCCCRITGCRWSSSDWWAPGCWRCAWPDCRENRGRGGWYGTSYASTPTAPASPSKQLRHNTQMTQIPQSTWNPAGYTIRLNAGFIPVY